MIPKQYAGARGAKRTRRRRCCGRFIMRERLRSCSLFPSCEGLMPVHAERGGVEKRAAPRRDGATGRQDSGAMLYRTKRTTSQLRVEVTDRRTRDGRDKSGNGYATDVEERARLWYSRRCATGHDSVTMPGRFLPIRRCRNFALAKNPTICWRGGAGRVECR